MCIRNTIFNVYVTILCICLRDENIYILILNYTINLNDQEPHICICLDTASALTIAAAIVCVASKSTYQRDFEL